MKLNKTLEKSAPIEVAAAIIRREGRFLICRRPENKARGLLWEFPGGKVEVDETPEAALIRECREELDALIRVGSLFAELTYSYPDISIHLMFYNAELSEGEPRLLEHSALAWVMPDETVGYNFCPADQTILTMLIKEGGSERQHI